MSELEPEILLVDFFLLEIDLFSMRLIFNFRGGVHDWTLEEQDCYFLEAIKVIASMPPGQCLGALEMLQQKFTISS